MWNILSTGNADFILFPSFCSRQSYVIMRLSFNGGGKKSQVPRDVSSSHWDFSTWVLCVYFMAYLWVPITTWPYHPTPLPKPLQWFLVTSLAVFSSLTKHRRTISSEEERLAWAQGLRAFSPGWVGSSVFGPLGGAEPAGRVTWPSKAAHLTTARKQQKYQLGQYPFKSLPQWCNLLLPDPTS